jgi:hypothetical protein
MQKIRRIVRLERIAYFIPKPFLEFMQRECDGYLDLNRALFLIMQAVAKNTLKNGGGINR